MTAINREIIRERLAAYVRRFPSQNKAAASLEVSPGVLIAIRDGNWRLISDEMWRNIGARVGSRIDDWASVETRTSKMFARCLSDAQAHSNVFAVTADAGSGKTFTAREYAGRNERCYLLGCNEYWNKKMFAQELLRVMGLEHGGLSVGEMMRRIVAELKESDSPLIVMDEADKLRDELLCFFITLYNQLEDHCGIVMCGTSYLRNRIEKGVAANKRGYREIYSRIGRRVLVLKGNTEGDVRSLCRANGIEDELLITEIVNEAEGDLRRVRRKIHALKQQEA